MLAKFVLLFAICLACVSGYSIGESYFRGLASKGGEICSDGNCACNQGETCCSGKNGYHCCQMDNAVCCNDSTECCPTAMPTCSTCSGVSGVIECCAEKDTKCCDGKCCHSDSFPGCTFGYCLAGKGSVPPIKKARKLQPNGPSEKCIEVSLSPEQTVYTGPSTTAQPTTTPMTTVSPSTTTTITIQQTTTTPMASTMTTTAMPPTSTTGMSQTTPTATASPAPTTTTASGTTTTLAGQQKDCAGWRNAGSTASGIYTIVVGGKSLQVYCDMTTDGGGWIVFQRRQDGSVNFTQSWDNYSNGFGVPTGEFWLGNSHISDISLADTQKMRVDLTDCQDNAYNEVYAQFSLSSELTNFTITLSGTSTGTAGDSLMYQCPGRFCQNGLPFTTYDRDHDNLSFGNCAVFQTGGWWYNQCGVSDLNGLYYSTCVCTACNPYQTGIFWFTYKNNGGNGYSFKKSEMKIRPAAFTPPPL